KHGGQVHVWQRKELENYLLNAAAISRAIIARLPRRGTPPTEGEVQAKLEELAGQQGDELLDAVAQEFLSADRSLGAAGANKAARQAITQRVERQGLLSCVSGKYILQRVFDWVQVEFGASLNTQLICRQFRCDEVDQEIQMALTTIENASKLPAEP